MRTDDHGALKAWLRKCLAQAHDTALHEPVPDYLLAILDAGRPRDASRRS